MDAGDSYQPDSASKYLAPLEKYSEEVAQLNGLPDHVRPLFVCGCQCSGTTAFADYLNEHEEILVCQERYKELPAKKITRDLFTFDQVLSRDPKKDDSLERVGGEEKPHAEILSGKDPAKLKWIGDKNPGYVASMNVLANNNPGARFIVLYRPVEEVAESFEARSKDPRYPWFNQVNGFDSGVEFWNRALIETKKFIEDSPTPRVLILSYHDFFRDSESCIPLLSNFLDIEFDEATAKAWKEMSRKFEGGRRRKKQITKDQQARIEECCADRGDEAWIVGRIRRQWEEPELYTESSRESARASLSREEAETWKLKQQMGNLQADLKLQRNQKRQSNERARSLTKKFGAYKQQLSKLEKETAKLEIRLFQAEERNARLLAHYSSQRYKLADAIVGRSLRIPGLKSLLRRGTKRSGDLG